MENEVSFVIIYDNTQESKVKYVSDSVTDILGWGSNELINRTAYSLFHKNDVPAIQQLHLAMVFQQKLSSMVTYRFLHKNGFYVRLESIINFCYDIIITTNSIFDEGSLEHKQRMNSIEEAFSVGENGELELLSMGLRTLTPSVLSKNDTKQQFTGTQLWQKRLASQESEPRFCLILNRYTEDMNIIFATHLATYLVGVSVDDMLGKPIFDFVDEKDHVMLEAQLSTTKSHSLLSRVRFGWTVDRDKDLYQPVDGFITGTTDGLVLIVRLQPKPLIL